MAGRGRLCLGYSNDPSRYADRVRDFTNVSSRDGRLVDALGLTVEDFGLSDNLMMIHALDLYGCALVTLRAFSLPDLICVPTVLELPNVSWT